jgi:hypothetical protein
MPSDPHSLCPLSSTEFVVPHEKKFLGTPLSSALFTVSFGGTASLFLGCSILSGVELLYYFTLRLICTRWTKHKEERKINRRSDVQQRLNERTPSGAVPYGSEWTYIHTYIYTMRSITRLYELIRYLKHFLINDTGEQLSGSHINCCSDKQTRKQTGNKL